MSVALSTRVFGAVPEHEVLVERLRALDVHGVCFHALPARPRTTRAALRRVGVEVVGVAASHRGEPPLDAAGVATSQLGASGLIVDAGPLDPNLPRDGQIEALARALHGWLDEGAPVAVLPGEGAGALLDGEALAWLLEDLPGLALWFDPVRVAGDAGRLAVLDRWAGRCRGIHVAGIGADGQGGRHPEEGGTDWEALRAMLPAGLPWVLDLRPEVDADELLDALRFVRHLA